MLRTAACLFLLCAAYSIVEALRPEPVEKTTAFVAAVRSFDMEKPATNAVERFRPFESIDRRSALPKFYLGFALSASLRLDDRNQHDADSYVQKALAVPDVENSAMTWLQDHPKFGVYLVEFADSRMRRADFLGEKYDVGPIEDAERDSDVRTPSYQLARDVLRLAEKLNAGSLTTQRLLAKTERYFGDYAAAYLRLTSIISRFNPGDQKDILFYSRQMRGWLVCFWAEHDRNGHLTGSKTRDRLVNADNDFGYCAKYLDNCSFGERQVQNVFYVMQHRLRTRVTLAEVELDLAMPAEANQHLDECRESAGRLAKYIESNKLDRFPLPTAWSRKDQCRPLASPARPRSGVPSLDKWPTRPTNP